MKGDKIGELEELVLLAVGSLYDGAYAVRIVNALNEHTTRQFDVTAIHSVLRRLEKKGFVRSEMGGATSDRGGRRKRLFWLTKVGLRNLDESMATRMTLYNKISRLTFNVVFS